MLPDLSTSSKPLKLLVFCEPFLRVHRVVATLQEDKGENHKWDAAGSLFPRVPNRVWRCQFYPDFAVTERRSPRTNLV